MASNMIGNLAVNLTMNTTAFQNGAKTAESRADTLKAKMVGLGASVAKLSGALALGGVAVGATVLGTMARSAFELGSSLTEAAAKVGVTVEALQEMRYAATQNGISVDTMDGSLNKMNKTLGELSLGNKKATESFGLLGLSAQNFIGLSPTEAFAKIADALLKIKNESERAAIGNKIFGRSYAELKPLINLGAKGIADAAEEKRKDGIISEQQAATLDELADGWDRLTEKVGVAAAQFIATTAQTENASEGLSNLGSNVLSLASYYDRASIAIEKFLRKLDLYDAEATKFMANRLKESSMTSWIPGVEGFANRVIDRQNVRIQRATSNDFGRRGVRGGTGRAPSSFRAPVVPKLDSSNFEGAMNRIESRAGRASQRIAKPITDAVDKVANAFATLEQNSKSLLDRLFPEVKAMVDYQADQNTLVEWSKAGKLSADQLAEALIRLRDSYFGAEGPIPVNEGAPLVKEIVDTLPDLTKAADKMSGQLKTVNVSISESFADMAKDVMSSLSGLANSIRGGGFLGILEGVINLGLSLGKIGAFGSKIQTNLNTPPGRARGGPINSNSPYLVGERGPEIFSTKRGGYITANDNISGKRQATEIKVIPSPFFETVVDERAKNVAAPLAMRGGLAGASLAESRLASRQRNRIP
jgi:hypothetical protein